MGRRRTFSEPSVVAAASATFVRHGYEGTSVDQLVADTGVQRSSLYHVFGSKRGLFLACLETVEQLDDTAAGLLLVALLDLAPHDDHVRARVRDLIAGLWTGQRPDAVHADLGHHLLARAGLTPEDLP